MSVRGGSTHWLGIIEALSMGHGVDMGRDGFRLPSAMITTQCMPSQRETIVNTTAKTRTSGGRSRKLSSNPMVKAY